MGRARVVPFLRPYTGRLQVGHWAGLPRAEGCTVHRRSLRDELSCQAFTKVMVARPRSAKI